MTRLSAKSSLEQAEALKDKIISIGLPGLPGIKAELSGKTVRLITSEDGTFGVSVTLKDGTLEQAGYTKDDLHPELDEVAITYVFL